MCQKYILHINKTQSFPYAPPTFASTHSLVRIDYQTPDIPTCEQLRRNINLLCSIQSPYVIPIHRVKESRGKSFTLDYELVSQPLIGSQKFEEPAFIQQTKCKIYKVFQQFAEKGIKCFPNTDQIGLDNQGEPKLYIRIDFQVVPSKERKSLLVQYQRWNEKLFESIKNLKQSKISISSRTSISEYTYKFDKILSQLQSKITEKKCHLRPRKWSQSKQDKDYGKSGTLISQVHLKRARNNSFNQIVSNRESEKLIEKKQGFFCQSSEKERSVQEWSESTKEGSLSQRISQALLKTNQMFKDYQRSKRRRI